MKIGFLSKAGVDIAEMKKVFYPKQISIFNSRASLREAAHELDILIAQNQGFYRFTIDADILRCAKKLRLVQHIGVAADITDVKAAGEYGIPVATVPAQNCRSVAETAMYIMLGCAKRGRTAQRLVGEGSMAEFQCNELGGKMLCLIGLGTIGKMLVPMARGFGMNIIAVRRDISKDGDIDGVEKIYPTEDLYLALRQADYIILVLPLNDETLHMIDDKAFSSIKSDAFIINMSRGDHIARIALEKALADGNIAGFGTDVFWKEPNDPDDPLLRDERVFATPHSGGKSYEAISGGTREVYKNIQRVIDGKVPLNIMSQ